MLFIFLLSYYLNILNLLTIFFFFLVIIKIKDCKNDLPCLDDETDEKTNEISLEDALPFNDLEDLFRMERKIRQNPIELKKLVSFY